MAKGAYIGVGDVARKVKQGYVGVDNVARKIKKGYIGIGGVARPFLSVNPVEYYGTITPLSVERYQIGSASVGGYALFAGGHNNNGRSETVDAYDGVLTRSTPTALSQAKYAVAGTSVGPASMETYAIFAGGRRDYTYSSVVNAYDTSLTRSTPTALQDAKYSLAATKVSDYALFGGGMGTSYSGYVDAYNTALTKSYPPNLSVARRYLQAAYTSAHAVFAGGYNGSTLDTVDTYDGSLTRTTLTSLSVARSQFAAATVSTMYGGYALFAGGKDVDGVTIASVEVYDSSLTKITVEDMGVKRQQHAATSIMSDDGVDSVVLIGGGADNSSGSIDYHVIVDGYDTSFTRFSAGSLQTVRYSLTAAIAGYNTALFAGGAFDNSDGTSDYYSVVDAFKWTQ